MNLSIGFPIELSVARVYLLFVLLNCVLNCVLSYDCPMISLWTALCDSPFVAIYRILVCANLGCHTPRHHRITKYKIIGDNRGIGLLQGLEIVKDNETKEHFDSSLKLNQILTEKLKKRGIWIRVPAYILPVCPPLIVTKDQIDQICSAVDESIGELEKEIS